MDLSVYPIRNAGKDDSGLTAMIFADSRAPEPVAPEGEAGVREKYDIDTTAARRITDLEQELQESQDDLRKTIGELETVNEELQAANEELYTVNTEYQQKVDGIDDDDQRPFKLPLLDDDRHTLRGRQPQHPQVHRVYRPRVSVYGAGRGPAPSRSSRIPSPTKRSSRTRKPS